MTSYLFDQDIFLRTAHPVALTSTDRLNPDGSGSVNDYTDGSGLARQVKDLLGVSTVIDLGTATGTVPLTMREQGLLAVGLEGSEAAQTRGIGAWTVMPDIVRTCDLGKPFEIVRQDGSPVTFDLVTSGDVLEHIPESDLDCFLDNTLRLMSPSSWQILEFSVAYNPADKYHQLWDSWEDGTRPGDVTWEARLAWVREKVERRFVIDEGMNSHDWDYTRPSAEERRQHMEATGTRIAWNRPVWWLRRRVEE